MKLVDEMKDEKLGVAILYKGISGSCTHGKLQHRYSFNL